MEHAVYYSTMLFFERLEEQKNTFWEGYDAPLTSPGGLTHHPASLSQVYQRYVVLDPQGWSEMVRDMYLLGYS